MCPAMQLLNALDGELCVRHNWGSFYRRSTVTEGTSRGGVTRHGADCCTKLAAKRLEGHEAVSGKKIRCFYPDITCLF